MNLEETIEKAIPDCREITFHMDGRVIAKTGSAAKNPKRLYTAKVKEGSWPERIKVALQKLIEDNK